MQAQSYRGWQIQVIHHQVPFALYFLAPKLDASKKPRQSQSAEFDVITSTCATPYGDCTYVGHARRLFALPAPRGPRDLASSAHFSTGVCSSSFVCVSLLFQFVQLFISGERRKIRWIASFPRRPTPRSTPPSTLSTRPPRRPSSLVSPWLCVCGVEPNESPLIRGDIEGYSSLVARC